MSSFAAFRVLGASRQGGQVLHHSAPALFLSAACLCLVSPTYAGDGYVGIYADSLGTTPCATIPQSTGATLYVIAQTDGGTVGGITGAEFRIEVTNPSGWLLSYTSPAAASVVLGNPIDTDPDPDAGGGLNLAFPSCQTPTGSGQVRLGTIAVYNLSGSATSLLVKRHSQPTSVGFTCPLFVKCDDPLYTKLCMTAAPPDSCTLSTQKGRVIAGDEETVFVASLNAGGGGGTELPRDPSREVWAQFTPGTVQLPTGATSATIANTTITSEAVADILDEYDIEGVAKMFPDFEPEDAFCVGRAGKTVRLQDLSEIYRFLLAESESVTELAEVLDEIIEYVVYAEPGVVGSSFSCPPNDPYFATKQWSLQNNGPTQFPGCTADADIRYCDVYGVTPSSSIIVAVIDTGVDRLHPDLMGQVINSSTDYSDVGHGTAIAGIIAAKTNTGMTGTGIAGIDPNARILAKQQLLPDEIRAAADEGAAVLNCSWGTSMESVTLLMAFRDVYVCNRVTVAAMGGDSKQYPAKFTQCVIAVGSTSCNDTHTWDSGTGPHIDVAAPGDSIWSSVPSAVDPTGYRYLGGTSMAAPHVSGLASLLLSVNPWLWNDDVEQLIRLSADDVNSATLPGPDEEMGAGRINAGRAFELLRFPYTLHHETAFGGTAVDSTGLMTVRFFVPPDSSYSAAQYRARRFEVRRWVDFPVTFDSIPNVWGRGAEDATTGYTPDSLKNWSVSWCGPVPGSITTSGATLRTYVYEVFTLLPPHEPIGWWPTRPDSVQYGYTILGQVATISSSGDSGDGTTVRSTLSCANPLRPGATISYVLKSPGAVRVDVFDVAGRLVRTLRQGEASSGTHEVTWDGRSASHGRLAAGLYLVRIKTAHGVNTRKVVVLE